MHCVLQLAARYPCLLKVFHTNVRYNNEAHGGGEGNYFLFNFSVNFRELFKIAYFFKVERMGEGTALLRDNP